MKKRSFKTLILAALISLSMLTAIGCSSGSSAPVTSSPFLSAPAASNTQTVPSASTVLPTASTPTTPTTPTIPTTPSTPTFPGNSTIYTEPDDEPDDYPIDYPGTVSIPVTPTPQGGSVNQAYVGYYTAVISQDYLNTLTPEEQAQVQQIVGSSSMTLNADGTMTLTSMGQQGSGTWSDSGNGAITLNVNGSTFQYTFSNGIIYDPNDTTSYFQKAG